jgi:hypothetical protein
MNRPTPTPSSPSACEPVFSTFDGTLWRALLRGGSKPRGVEFVRVSNFVPRVVSRRELGGVSLLTIEGTRPTQHGTRSWCVELPERFLDRPQALKKALAASLGPTEIVWVGQIGNLAKYLAQCTQDAPSVRTWAQPKE